MQTRKHGWGKREKKGERETEGERERERERQREREREYKERKWCVVINESKLMNQWCHGKSTVCDADTDTVNTRNKLYYYRKELRKRTHQWMTTNRKTKHIQQFQQLLIVETVKCVLSFCSSLSIGEYVFLVLFHFLLSSAVTRLFSCIIISKGRILKLQQASVVLVGLYGVTHK